MKTSLSLAIVFAAALLASPSFAQENAASSSSSPAAATASTGQPVAGAPNEAEMMKQMMELSKLNENHKLLADMAGTWNYTVKMWMNPADASAKPETYKGTAVRKPIMEGRYYTLDVAGKMEMPGADGKKKEMMFKGMSIEGYDNVKKKFIGTWIDNMGTGMMFSEGTYDPATKTFTYSGEFEAVPGMKQQIRETLKVVDKNHHVMEWYENRGGQEMKTMEIDYTRKK